MIARDPEAYASHAFPVGLLPDPAAGFVREASQALNVPPAFVALPLLSALSSAVGTTCRLRIKRTWAEFPILWTAIVGESGTGKTPAMRCALAPIYAWQAKALSQHEADMQAHAAALLEHEEAVKTWRKNGGEPPVEPQTPQPRRFVTGDATTEALAKLLKHEPRGILLAADELSGWLRSHDQYRNGRGGDTARWLELHQGGTLIVDRKGSGTIHVPRAAVSICGGIQPKVLAESLGREHFENGLAARLLLAMPEARPAGWSDAELSPATDTAMTRVFERLANRQHLPGESPVPMAAEFNFDDTARRTWIYALNQRAAMREGLTGDHAAMAAKLDGYTARLALLFHLVREASDDPTLSDPASVDAQSVAAADQLAQWFGREASRIYARLGEDREQADAREIVDLARRRGGTLTAGDLRHARPSRYPKLSDAVGELRAAAGLGFGTIDERFTRPKGGRPSVALLLGEEYAEEVSAVNAVSELGNEVE